jgi:hypothetical protein
VTPAPPLPRFRQNHSVKSRPSARRPARDTARRTPPDARPRARSRAPLGPQAPCCGGPADGRARRTGTHRGPRRVGRALASPGAASGTPDRTPAAYATPTAPDEDDNDTPCTADPSIDTLHPDGGVDHESAAGGPGRLRRRARRLDHESAAGWITLRAPLKPEVRSQATMRPLCGALKKWCRPWRDRRARARTEAKRRGPYGARPRPRSATPIPKKHEASALSSRGPVVHGLVALGRTDRFLRRKGMRFPTFFSHRNLPTGASSPRRGSDVLLDVGPPDHAVRRTTGRTLR